MGYHINTCLELYCVSSNRVQCLFFNVWVNPKNTLRYRNGVTLMEQGDTPSQNYVKKLKARLKWAYQIAHKNNQKESEHHKKYYDKRIRCMSLKPDDLVLVHAKVPSGDHKIAD